MLLDTDNPLLLIGGTMALIVLGMSAVICFALYLGKSF